MFETYAKMLYRLSWQYHQQTGVDFEDLLGEAEVAYCKAAQHYDPARPVQFSTYLYTAVLNQISSFIQRELRNNQYTVSANDVDLETVGDVTKHDHFWAVLEDMPEDARRVCRMVLDSPQDYLRQAPKMTRGQIKRQLRSEWGWTHQRIWGAFHSIHQALKETC